MASVSVVKIAIDPVWYLPGIAERFGAGETELRRTLFEQTGGMFPELVTRPDMKVFLPPIGGITVYMFGDVTKLPDHAHARSPAACMTSATAPTCSAPTSAPAGPISSTASRNARAARRRAALGLIVYNRKEGRALGEVTKFLVYNARKRQEGGDAAAAYFERTECVAGVQDARFQQLMPDMIHWLGLKRIDRFVSMSDMKYDALTSQGIEIGERVPIPDELIPADAACRDGRQEGRRLLHARQRAARRTLNGVGRALAGKVLIARWRTAVGQRRSAPLRCSAPLPFATRAAARCCALGLAGGLPHFTCRSRPLDGVADGS